MIRDFRHGDFEQVARCYERGFPEGHNRYSLSRLIRWFEGEGNGQGTILVAEEEGVVVGVVIGISTHWRAWMTGLSVLPGHGGFLGLNFVKLLLSLAFRFATLGYTEAYATTARMNMKVLADRVGAELLREEQDFFFDGRSRWLYRVDLGYLSRFQHLLG